MKINPQEESPTFASLAHEKWEKEDVEFQTRCAEARRAFELESLARAFAAHEEWLLSPAGERWTNAVAAEELRIFGF